MWTVLWQALVLALGGLFSIGSILIVILFLSSRRGLLKALAYIFGYSGGYALIGVLVIAVGHQFCMGDGSAGGRSWISGFIFILLGAILLFFAQRRLRNPSPANAAPPKWLASIDTMSPRKALGFGAMVVALNFKNMAIYLSAIAVILTSRLSLLESLASVFAIVSVFCAAVYLPILLYVVFASRASGWLQSMRLWLEQNNRTFSIALMLIFGIIFLSKGVFSLI